MEDKEKEEKEEREDKKSSPYVKPQPVEEKKSRERKVVAAKTCTVRLDNCTVELVAGDEVHGLTRQERDHLLFHGFIK